MWRRLGMRSWGGERWFVAVALANLVLGTSSVLVPLMLSRVLEPEVMDSPEEAAAYDAMDHRGVNSKFVDDLLAQGPRFGELLDMGVGTARIPIELCQRSEEVRVVGVDMSSCMLDIAGINVELAALRDRILLDRQDAKHLVYEDGRFDAELVWVDGARRYEDDNA